MSGKISPSFQTFGMARMTVPLPDSPVQIILAQGATIALTSSQRRDLELLDVEFRNEALQLWAERQRLELDADRIKIYSHAGIGFTPESLAALDTTTAKLRQAWLRAREDACAKLTAEQLAKLREDSSGFPSFDSDLTSTGAKLDGLVAEAVAARIKDAKVVEIETAQAIAERLFGWAKSAAVITAVPLAILVMILTVLGISNWVDFQTRITASKKEVETQLEAAKKSAGDVGSQAETLRLQYAELKKQFGDVQMLANDVQDLSRKVKRLEGIQFEASPALSPETEATIKKEIKEYRAYLQSVGYQTPATDLNVAVDPEMIDNAYYDGKKMVIGPKLVNMPDVIDREYTQRVLLETKPHYFDTQSWHADAIYSGLADYFPCSYQGNAKFGEKYVETFRDNMPAIYRVQGYLRGLENKRPFVSEAASSAEKEQHAAGEVWGGVFWDIRSILGCKSNSPGCEAADRVLLASWIALNASRATGIDTQFARIIIQNIRQSFGADQADKVRDAFAARGLRKAI